MSAEAVKGLQDKRNEAIYNGNLDESDYLGDAFRGNWLLLPEACN